MERGSQRNLDRNLRRSSGKERKRLTHSKTPSPHTVVVSRPSGIPASEPVSELPLPSIQPQPVAVLPFDDGNRFQAPLFSHAARAMPVEDTILPRLLEMHKQTREQILRNCQGSPDDGEHGNNEDTERLRREVQRLAEESARQREDEKRRQDEEQRREEQRREDQRREDERKREDEEQKRKEEDERRRREENEQRRDDDAKRRRDEDRWRQDNQNQRDEKPAPRSKDFSRPLSLTLAEIPAFNQRPHHDRRFGESTDSSYAQSYSVLTSPTIDDIEQFSQHRAYIDKILSSSTTVPSSLLFSPSKSSPSLSFHVDESSATKYPADSSTLDTSQSTMTRTDSSSSFTSSSTPSTTHHQFQSTFVTSAETQDFNFTKQFKPGIQRPEFTTTRGTSSGELEATSTSSLQSFSTPSHPPTYPVQNDSHRPLLQFIPQQNLNYSGSDGFDATADRDTTDFTSELSDGEIRIPSSSRPQSLLAHPKPKTHPKPTPVSTHPPQSQHSRSNHPQDSPKSSEPVQSFRLPVALTFGQKIDDPLDESQQSSSYGSTLKSKNDVLLDAFREDVSSPSSFRSQKKPNVYGRRGERIDDTLELSDDSIS
ncbi:hypothetical protein BLNAU_2817 [Blattamonas nauphoetae]|uniref:Uncharacterized protein n=1 Tax=Blattamonas nauphoetae TaxID=2049346 RepID=A0ABQ9YEH4_9EUKA|nr:hypothetical protein BLNAU_2817 [Blattamonas nauphoetae]